VYIYIFYYHYYSYYYCMYMYLSNPTTHKHSIYYIYNYLNLSPSIFIDTSKQSLAVQCVDFVEYRIGSGTGLEPLEAAGCKKVLVPIYIDGAEPDIDEFKLSICPLGTKGLPVDIVVRMGGSPGGSSYMGIASCYISCW